MATNRIILDLDIDDISKQVEPLIYSVGKHFEEHYTKFLQDHENLVAALKDENKANVKKIEDELKELKNSFNDFRPDAKAEMRNSINSFRKNSEEAITEIKNGLQKHIEGEFKNSLHDIVRYSGSELEKLRKNHGSNLETMVNRIRDDLEKSIKDAVLAEIISQFSQLKTGLQTSLTKIKEENNHMSTQLFRKLTEDNAKKFSDLKSELNTFRRDMVSQLAELKKGLKIK